MTVAVRQFDRCNLHELQLESTCAHDGDGLIQFRRIAARGELAGRLNFMDFASIPPGVTIGEHTHAATEEEFYLILSGTGRMTRNGEVFDVRAGDLIRNPPGGTHALVNTGDENLQMFVFEAEVP